MNGRLIIVDPSLKDQKGHHYALTKAISDGALKNDLDVMIFANKNISSLPGIKKAEIHPVFSSTTYDPFIKPKVKQRSSTYRKIGEKIPKSIRLWLKRSVKTVVSLIKGNIKEVANAGRETLPLHMELLHAIERNGLTSADHILIHTADGDMYRELLQMAVSPNFNELPYFHVNTPYDDTVMPHYNKGITPERVVNYLSLMGKLECRVFLYAENKLLSDYLANLWSARVCPLEIPPTEHPQGESQGRKGSLNVVYLGAAREEKGFLLIPEVVKIISNSQEKLNVKFTLQCSPQIIGYLPVISKAIASLREYAASLVTLIEKQQSMSEYFSTIEAADVILLCYDKNRYGVRGSGVAVEAVTFGKVIIATPGTFPAYVAEDAAVLASNAAEVAQAIVEVSRNKETYMKRAKSRKERYFQENSSEEYVKLISARADEFSAAVDSYEENDYDGGNLSSCNGDVELVLTFLLSGNADNAQLSKLVVSNLEKESLLSDENNSSSYPA